MRPLPVALMLAATLLAIPAASADHDECLVGPVDPTGNVWTCAQRSQHESGDPTCETTGTDSDIFTTDVWETNSDLWIQLWMGYHCADHGTWGFTSDHARVLLYHPALGQVWVGYFAYEWDGGGGHCAFFVYHGGAAGYLYQEAPCVAGPLEPWPFPLPV